MQTALPTSVVLPRSCGGWADPLIAVVVGFLAYALSRHRDVSDVALAIIIVLSIATVMSAIEYRRVNRSLALPRTNWRALFTRAFHQWLDAMIGLVLVIAFWWALAAEYGRPEYKPLWVALERLIPVAPVAILAFIVLTEWRLGSKAAPSPSLAQVALTRGRSIDHEAIVQAVLALLVRAIFLPLNFCVLVRCIEHFRGREVHLLSNAWPAVHADLLVALYGLLIATIVPGYLFSSRLLDTHVRKVDTSLLGWCATLACYRPLSLAVFDRWLNYHGRPADSTAELPWIVVSSGWASLVLVIGLLILALEVVHLWAEASFGLRASNLTNRGIITHGPYRFCKHPIYIAKCLGWLLLFLPFASSTIDEALRSSILFAGVCILYALRAYSEERLLAQDPAYVEYAIWMDKYGLFAGVGRAWPSLTFGHRYGRWQAESQRE